MDRKFNFQTIDTSPLPNTPAHRWAPIVKNAATSLMSILIKDLVVLKKMAMPMIKTKINANCVNPLRQKTPFKRLNNTPFV